MSQFSCSTFVPGILNSVYFSSVLFLFVSGVDDNESLKDEKYTKIKGINPHLTVCSRLKSAKMVSSKSVNLEN